MAKQDLLLTDTDQQRDIHLVSVWHVLSPAGLLWEEWETEYTLFDRNSGETHLINEVPAQMLRILTENPKTTFDLAEELSRLCEVENTELWRQKTLAILDNLESLGLIEARGP